MSGGETGVRGAVASGGAARLEWTGANVRRGPTAPHGMFFSCRATEARRRAPVPMVRAARS
jgi:hypothetical protein